jgi:2-phosphosulfolactate phosphatase
VQIDFATLDTCPHATGTVVVIDVLRAFTTACYAFIAGAPEILLVSGVQEALDLRRRFPGAAIMGEVGGLPIPEFDYGNSPLQFDGRSLAGRPVIQRTSAGTQGVVLSARADTLLAASFTCAAATARFVEQQAPARVTFVITGIYHDRDGDEDWACAEYLAAVLRGERPDPTPYLRRVRDSDSGRLFTDPYQPEFAPADLDRSLEIDRFDRALLVRRQDDLLIMRPASTLAHDSAARPST